jgi:hypothetical protein
MLDDIQPQHKLVLAGIGFGRATFRVYLAKNFSGLASLGLRGRGRAARAFQSAEARVTEPELLK